MNEKDDQDEACSKKPVKKSKKPSVNTIWKSIRRNMRRQKTKLYNSLKGGK
jgi:hypothetical protein